MKRREFIAALGSVMIGPAQAQQPMRLVGFLEGISRDTPGARGRYAAFLQALDQLGWTTGRNLRIELHYGEGDEAATRKYAAELVALAPDVLVAGGAFPTEMLLKVTRTIPIVFAIATDPVGSGLVETLPQPGGKATGFMMFEYNQCAKWLEQLKQIDKVAYIRFASVYRDFKDVDEFRSELEHLLAAKEEKSRPARAKSGAK